MSSRMQTLVSNPNGREILKEHFGTLALDLKTVPDFHILLSQLVDVEKLEQQKNREIQLKIDQITKRCIKRERLLKTTKRL